MIVVNESSPRWIRELDRFRHIKNLIFLQGNVLDPVVYATERDGETHWTDGDTIDGFLTRFFAERGYPLVGVLDPIGGLEIRTDANNPRAGDIDRPNGSDQPGAGERRSAASDRARQPAPSGGRDGGPDAIGAGIAAIARAITNRDTPCAFIITLASRMIASPGYPSEREHALLAQLLKASLQGVTAFGPDGERTNLIVLVCDKLNDFPPFLYVDNPRARSIQVEKPDRAARERFFRINADLFHGSTPAGAPLSDLAARFGFLTEGLANYELQSLLALSRAEQIPIQPADALVSRYKFGITASEWDSPELRRRLTAADEVVRQRVKGQEAAVARVTDLVKRAWLGLAAGDAGRSHRPRGVLFFAGPTGVGKTEMAKALAELLFGSEERMIRFDMSEYAAEHADQRLLGSPPGYVGYEEGGQLTNQVKQNPFSVLLFDEIEKAHPRIFDKFLQILDDGRLTDGKGDTVYFSESVIIFTSNLGSTALNRRDASTGSTAPDGIPDKSERPTPAAVHRDMPYAQVRDAILDAIQRHFNDRLGRPEILNRFGDNFVVFDFIRPPLHVEIVEHMIGRLCAAMGKVHGIDLVLSETARTTIERLAEDQLEHGGRGIRNIIDRALVDPLARWLFDHGTSDPGQALGRLEILAVTDHGEAAPCRFSIEGRGTAATAQTGGSSEERSGDHA